MIHNTKKFYAILFSLALLALLIITITLRAIDAPIERDIAKMQAEMTEAWSAFEAQQAAQLADFLENTKPAVEYKGRLFFEGMVIEGEVTHYCRCAKCNDAENEGITADGTVLDDTTPPIAGCNWLPLQSVVEVNGVQYRIADRGTKGGELETLGRLDIYTPEGHQAALDAGRPQGIEIKIIKLGEVK